MYFFQDMKEVMTTSLERQKNWILGKKKKIIILVTLFIYPFTDSPAGMAGHMFGARSFLCSLSLV